MVQLAMGYFVLTATFKRNVFQNEHILAILQKLEARNQTSRMLIRLENDKFLIIRMPSE